MSGAGIQSFTSRPHAGVSEGDRKRCVVVKIAKGKSPKDEVHQPQVVGEAEPRTANLEALAKSFAPVITVRAVVDLKVNPRNARTHSPQQVEQIGASVREFGWITPIVVDEDGVVLAGHGRLQAAHLLGLTGVPTVEVKHLTAERKRAFMLADNRLAEPAGWDESLLTSELQELSDLNIDFDFEVTGFGTVDTRRGGESKDPGDTDAQIHRGRCGRRAARAVREHPRPDHSRPPPGLDASGTTHFAVGIGEDSAAGNRSALARPPSGDRRA